MGYRLHKQFWGKGYATELAKRLIAWGFQSLLIEKLVAVTHPDNLSSQHALQKAGMRSAGKTIYWEKEVFYFEIYKSEFTDTKS